MSNKTQLQTNNTKLDALITRVNSAKDTAASLPEAGSGGSSEGLEVCTVTINCPDTYLYYANYTTIENGVITPVSFWYRGLTEASDTITVVKGSMFAIEERNNGYGVLQLTTNGCDCLYNHAGHFYFAANSSGSITIKYQSGGTIG